MSRLLAPLRNWIGRRQGYGQCIRCADSWYWKPRHNTTYHLVHGIDTRLIAPLCQECWAGLEPRSRWHYYGRLLEIWADQRNQVSYDERLAIYQAVLDGR